MADRREETPSPYRTGDHTIDRFLPTPGTFLDRIYCVAMGPSTDEMDMAWMAATARDILAMPEMQAIAKLLRSLPTTQDGWALALAMEALPQSVLDWAGVMDADGEPVVGRSA